ncbi:hypothetical protein BGZ63DRAFT_347553 [Mariannaea sp. PMI_226]|nr:hypothetical protein BGZ63DRAFT_347553 [Mariannaea sp. PMI_226]
MSDKQEYTQTEHVPVKSKRGSCARHCKRFWWVHLIIFIIIVVVTVPVIIFVAVPKIAQKKVNEAKLNITGVNMLQTETNTFLLAINSTITTDGSIKANIDAFEGEMYLEDYEPHTPFLSVQFPKTNGDKHQLVNISQQVNITDMDAFSRFNVWFHNNETVRVTLNGKTKVKPSGLDRKYDVTFKKTVTFKGLNMFDGTTVTNGHISFSSDTKAKNFNGTAIIPNASVFTLDIGNITFTNFINDQKVGTLYIQNFLLVPGDNHVNITANMNQATVLSAAAQQPYCKTGTVPFKLLGQDVENDGDSLPYFEAALSSVNQTVEIDIGSILKADLGSTIKCKS